jgi:alpha,alpha-trehalase
MPSEEYKISDNDIDKVTSYIDSYWPKLVRENKEDLRSLIGLPNPYIIPTDSGVFQEQYYWDSYPVIRALIDHPKYSKLAIGMVDNLLHLVERFGIIPNASRLYFLTRSQPPLLSSMVWEVFEKTQDKQWFKRAIELVELEYNDVWMGKIHLRNYRLTDLGLSRYYDLNALDNLAEAESGWDMTVRFGGECLNYCPVDLNCLLYLYERDMASAYGLFGNKKKKEYYIDAAEKREKLINELMWDKKTGYYYDYNFVKGKRSPLITVAGVYPLNIGMASNSQAQGVIGVIKKILQKKYGVVQSVKFVENKQWDYPNGWAPLQLRSIEGLMRYGENSFARRLISKWLALNIKIFKDTGKLWEKYDVVHGKVGVPDRYPTLHGFAWTNATFLIMARVLKKLEGAQDNATPLWMVRRLGWF